MELAIVVDVERIQAKIKQVRKVVPGEGMNTIFRIPAHICRGREDLFRPHMVAIGPYHRGRADLQKMEQVKWQFLLELKEKSESDLRSYVEALRGLEERARACYFDEVFLDSHEFIEMLLLDGCFIVQFLIKWHISMKGGSPKVEDESESRDTELSVVCGNGWWSIGSIRHDLFLLENQIPFIVLQEIFELICPLYFRSQCQLDQMVFEFLVESSTSLSMSKMPDTSPQPYHLLHLCYLCYTKRESDGSTTSPSHETKPTTRENICYLCNMKTESDRSTTTASHETNSTTRENLCYLCNAKTESDGSTTTASHETNSTTRENLCNRCYTKASRETTPEKKSIGSRRIYSAANLMEAGVTFRKKENADTFFGIEFTADGILKIPFISVDEDTMHRLANLVALEQCDKDVGTDITTYALLMDCLIDTSDDVEVLRRGKILGKMMASNTEVADFFNQLCAYSTFSTHNNHFQLAKVLEDIEKYCTSTWHENRAILMHDYFRNPWTFLSVVAALMILLFTASQALMGFYSSIHHNEAIKVFLMMTIIPPILMIVFIIIKKMN